MTDNLLVWLFVAVLVALGYRRFLGHPQNRGFWDYILSTAIVVVITVVVYMSR